VPAGATVLVAPGSAMRDGRRAGEPERFDPDRPAVAQMHFGLGLHGCFGIEMAQAMLPALLAPLLRRRGLRAAGRLRKRGAHAEAFPLAV
jgi:cytochrome P450